MPKTKLNHRQKISAGRFLAKKRMPYFAAGLYSLIPRPVPGMMKTMGGGMAVTPNGVMIYDPDVIENEWTLDDVEFGLLHELGHILRNHSKVTEKRGWDPKLANLAFDAAINDDLFAAGMKPLPSDMLPSKIQDPVTMKPMGDGLTEHAYYDALTKMKNPPQAVPGARPGGGACGGGAGNPFPGESAYGGGTPGPGASNSGNQKNNTDGGRSEAEIERVRKQVARDIQQHTQKGRGEVPGGWQVWANSELKPPKVRWQDKLRRVIRGAVSNRAGMLDYTYSRPSRRQSAVGYGYGRPILPAMSAPTPALVVAVDTSGSMNSNDLARAVSETKGILTQTAADVHLLSCDAEVHGPPRKVRTWKEVQNALKGGGGTAFGPIFEAARKIPERPTICVVLTDGGGPAPATPPPNMTVIWVLIGEKTDNWCGAMEPWVEGDHDAKVPYGEKVWVGT